MVSGAASATANVTAVPTGWKLQSYGGVSTTLWYTGSPCTNGQLTFDASESPDRNKLLWATILAAKSAQLPVSIDYDIGNNAGGTICVIRTFAIEKS